jgi:hypothetical protein
MLQVLSAVMNMYDPIDIWIDQTIPYRRTVFTDQVAHPTPIDPHGVAIPMQAPHLHPRMAAKLPKCLPQEYVDGSATEILWVDGSIVPRRSDFLEWVVSHEGPLCQFPHHERPDGSLYQELEASAWQGKYFNLPLLNQVKHYAERGMDIHYGVWATGVILYRPQQFDWQCSLSKFGSEWLLQQTRWGYQDQISQPYVLWKHGMKPAPLEGAVIGNSYFDLRPHGSAV